MPIRIATFNLENLDDGANVAPPLGERVGIMRPQLERIGADILCLQEVHSQGAAGARTLSALDTLLAGTEYANFHRQTTLTTTGELYDVRNLVTLSRYPVTETKIVRDSSGPGPRPSYQMATANPPDTTSDFVSWERPILYTKINITAGLILHVLNLHMKSKIASNIPGRKINSFTWESVSAWAEGSFIAAMKRVGQSVQARFIIDNIFDTEGESALIAICGDFNSESDEVPVKAICGHVEETGNPAHSPRLMVPCENNIPGSARYSLFHLGRGQMLDHIIVSRPMFRFFEHAEIHNEALPDESGAFRQDTKFPESDHAPVIAEFEIT
jgi:endonuclease/exonuclease/phosphatase family metal-dependent hydrolase